MRIIFALIVAVVACLATTIETASVETRPGVADSHVIGGVAKGSKEAPFVAQLQLSKNGKIVRRCGAARLNNQWFITAAECLDQSKYDHVRIVYPASLWGYIDFDFYDCDLLNLKFKIHPQYKPETKTNNIALIRIDFTSPPVLKQYPVLPLKNVSEAISFKNAFVYSWGLMKPTSKKAVINEVETRVLNPTICNVLHLFTIKDNNIFCTYGTSNRGTTEDDAGAPLVLRGDGNSPNSTIIGIATSYRPWAILTQPMMYTKLYPYLEWIYQESNVAPHESI